MLPRLCSITRAILALALVAAAGLAADRVSGEESAPIEHPRWLFDAQPPPGVRVRDVRATSAIVEWPASLGGQGRFRIETMHLVLNDERALAQSWGEMGHASVARQGENFSARLSRLAPQQPHWVRVLPLDPSGAVGAQLFVVRFDTPAKAPLFTPWRAALGVLLLLLGAIGWRRWRRRAA